MELTTIHRAQWEKGKSGPYVHLSILNYGASVSADAGLGGFTWRVTFRQAEIASGVALKAADGMQQAETTIQLHHQRQQNHAA